MLSFFRNSVISVFFLLGIAHTCHAQEGNYYLTWRNFINSAYFLADGRQQETQNIQDYYWSGEIEREFGHGLRIGLALATAKRSQLLPTFYKVEVKNYFQKSFSIGLGGKLYNVKSENNMKLQGGLYAFLNWLDNRDVAQIYHYYGNYLEPIHFKKEAFPSFVAHFAFLHQLSGRFEVEYAFQISVNPKIENTRRNVYYLASTGRVNQMGTAFQFHLNFKYAMLKR